MRYRTMLALLAFAAGSTACGALRSSDGHCSGQQCKVAVTVGANCAVTADPYELQVRRDLGPVNIRWKLEPGSNYVFDSAKGITFPPGQNPDAEFDEKRPEEQGKQFHWRDRNTREGKFKYGITLRDANDPSRVCHYDPFIHNH